MLPNLTNKTKNELFQLACHTKALAEKRKYRYIDFVFPDTGKYSKSAYPKVMEFYAAGKDHRFRMMAGGNGSGKTFDLAVEWVYHWTGQYPKDWNGLRMKNPKTFWIIAESPGTFRDSIQKLLLGNTLNEEDFGTGLIPKDCIVNTSSWQGAGAGIVSEIQIRHTLGHIVTVAAKSSDQKRENLQAATLDGVWWDEEPPKDLYDETLMRLRGNPTKPPGIGLLGFTSLKGFTEVVSKWCPDAEYPIGQHPEDPQKYVVNLDVEKDCPHLTKEDIDVYLQNFSGAQLEARLRGKILMGAGQIYPYPEDQVFIRPFKIPDHWPRCYALDYGHHVTCALWGAKDPNTGILYIYAEYYCKGHQTAQIHALNIKAKGEWIPGIGDPSGGGRQDDGRQLVDLFRQHGLNITPGDNSIVGISRNCNMFENGTLKIFDTCVHTRREYRMYKFDEKNPNQPARNQDDHAMDNIKYMTGSFDYVARTDPAYDYYKQKRTNSRNYDRLTGY